MPLRAFHVLALMAVVAAPLSPAVAGSPYNDGADSVRSYGGTASAVPSRRAGHFSCSMNEVRTKLERKNCGERRF